MVADSDDFVMDQQDVFYTVTQNGKAREFMVILPKSIDIEVLKEAVKDQISVNPNISGEYKVHIQNIDGIIGG